MQNDSQQHGRRQDGGNAGGGHGASRVQVRVQTPRGLWSMTEPETATKRPDYTISTPVSSVIEDARAVFGFVEQDSLYTLFLNGTQMEPGRPLASYHVADGALMVLSVQGGNASGR
jgi:hypothetical protein